MLAVLMEYYDSQFGIVELTDERANHIFTFHPDVRAHTTYFGKTLSSPTTIRGSKFDPSVLVLYKRINSHYLAIVIKTNNLRNFILTAYITHKIQHKPL